MSGIRQMRGNSLIGQYTYQYDINRNIVVKNDNGAAFTFSYDRLNRIKTSSQFNEVYTYDQRDNRSTLQSEQEPTLKGASYAYDHRNRLTRVTTEEGKDKVLSKNEETGEVAYKAVTATFNHDTDEIYQIHVGNQVIESTFNHPFYVEGKGWTFVKDLKVGDLLVQSDGNTLKIDSIELEHKHVTVYNMTVDKFHTYFVSDLGIWVHNSNCNFSVWNKGSFDAVEGSAQYHFKKHGKEVGAEDLAQYLRKAEEFAKTAKKGSTKSYVNGAVEGTIRYKKNGRYIDIAPDGTIVSFGKQ
ncbi:polymorphic toxin-type HINT domain-containing protein [Paenibacillus thiaminolyticus]|uniref:polymorphic toxin-type HINT domain-containing protein n=1 Tax=Paenibacillus thiaminolyticus TaxID=49283 RepID=UPI0035A57F84